MKEVEAIAVVPGLPLTPEQAVALAALQGPAVQNLNRFPDSRLAGVEPQVWFRPISTAKDGAR